MPEKKGAAPKHVTKEILRKEINRLDVKIDDVTNRLDAKIEWKIDAAVQSMKDYTDSRYTQLDGKIDKLEQKMDTIQENILKRLDSSVRGIMDIIKRSGDDQIKLEEQVEDHERRIIKLEERAEL